MSFKEALSLTPLIIIMALALSISNTSRAITDQEIENFIQVPEVSDQEIVETLSRHYDDISFSFTPGTRSGTSSSLEGNLTIDGAQYPVPRFFLAFLYHLLLNSEPTKWSEARIRRVWEGNRPLPQAEQKYLEARNKYAKKVIEEYLQEEVDEDLIPRIAVIGSGGGFRAMLSTAGFCQGLADTSLLDTVHYLGGVSGSTWLIGSWLASKKPYLDFYPGFKKRVASTLLDEALTKGGQNLAAFMGTIAETFIRRLAYHEIPTIIDLYGLLIGLELFEDHTKGHYAQTTLASFADYVSQGTVPLPIGMSVHPYEANTKFHEVEFTPFEVMHYGINGACPTFGFGRKFKCGKSTTKHPSLSLGYLMGIWGSAFTLALKQIFPLIAQELRPSFLFKPLQTAIMQTPLGEFQLFPAFIRNPVRNLQAGGDPHSQFHIHIDAGAAQNIPIEPVLRDERTIDIIIIVEASADCFNAPNLHKLEDSARAANKLFPTIDYYQAITEKYSIFYDGPDSSAPIIIYVPLAKNDDYDPTFDPQELLRNGGGFINTGNFAYTPAQIDRLTGLTERAAHELAPTIIDAIKAVITRKKVQKLG